MWQNIRGYNFIVKLARPAYLSRPMVTLDTTFTINVTPIYLNETIFNPYIGVER